MILSTRDKDRAESVTLQSRETRAEFLPPTEANPQPIYVLYSAGNKNKTIVTRCGSTVVTPSKSVR
jgi:hypothetical protein